MTLWERVKKAARRLPRYNIVDEQGRVNRAAHDLAVQKARLKILGIEAEVLKGQSNRGDKNGQGAN
jgi:hypothetical protein